MAGRLSSSAIAAICRSLASAACPGWPSRRSRSLGFSQPALELVHQKIGRLGFGLRLRSAQPRRPAAPAGLDDMLCTLRVGERVWDGSPNSRHRPRSPVRDVRQDTCPDWWFPGLASVKALIFSASGLPSCTRQERACRKASIWSGDFTKLTGAFTMTNSVWPSPSGQSARRDRDSRSWWHRPLSGCRPPRRSAPMRSIPGRRPWTSSASGIRRRGEARCETLPLGRRSAGLLLADKSAWCPRWFRWSGSAPIPARGCGQPDGDKPDH